MEEIESIFIIGHIKLTIAYKSRLNGSEKFLYHLTNILCK